MLNQNKPAIPTGFASIDGFLGGWNMAANYLISGTDDKKVTALTSKLAQNFASERRQVIWMGFEPDFRRLSKQILLREAGLDYFDDPMALCLGDKQLLKIAHYQTRSLPIFLCDLAQCGDLGIESEFLESIITEEPTLILVEASIFTEEGLDLFEILVRRYDLFRMIREIKQRVPNLTILWHIPAVKYPGHKFNSRMELVSRSIGNIDDHVVMFVDGGDVHQNRSSEVRVPQLSVKKNVFGRTGWCNLHYDFASSTWQELCVKE